MPHEWFRILVVNDDELANGGLQLQRAAHHDAFHRQNQHRALDRDRSAVVAHPTLRHCGPAALASQVREALM